MPVSDQKADIWKLVQQDMEARGRLGSERYGVPLTADTPKDFLQEHYEELLDACVYIRAEIERRRGSG